MLEGMVAAVLLAFGSAIVGAILGAYLQKRWTPDPSSEIAALRKQVAAFQQRIETLEQERAESEHLAPEMSLQHAGPGNYTMLVKNGSDEEVAVAAVNQMYGDVELSTPSRPRPTDDWRIAPRSEKQICWAPQTDPVVTLQWIAPNVGRGLPVPISLVVICRIRGKPRTLRRAQLMMVGYLHHLMTPVGP